jgi:hypothetical protein
MFKILKFTFFTSIVLAILGVCALYVKRVDLTEQYLSKKLNAEVKLEDVSIGLKRFALEGLLVKPRGSSIPYLFKAEEISITASPFNFFKEEIEIENVKIQSPTLGVLLFNRSGSENSLSAALNDAHVSGRKKYKIDNLKIINLQFSAHVASGRGITLPTLPYLELHDLKGFSFNELQCHLFERIGEKQPALSALFEDLSIREVESVERDLLGGIKKRADDLLKSIKKRI